MGNIGYKSCTDCGDEGMPVKTISIPTCGSPVEPGECASQKGKFFDKLIEDFVVPKNGNEGKLFVCEGNLWAKHQWVAVVMGSEKIAAFQIVKVSNKSITV